MILVFNVAFRTLSFENQRMKLWCFYSVDSRWVQRPQQGLHCVWTLW